MRESELILKGQLFLDSGRLRGSFFQRAVVLVCEEGAKGTFGLVLNRASGTNVGGLLVAGLPETLEACPLFVGGPVEPSALSFLRTETFLPDANVLPSLSVGYSWDGLCEIEASFSPARKIRIFAGYAGWSPGQLEEEVRCGAWIQHPASIPLIFDVNARQLWETILRQKGWRYRLLAQMPEDPSLN
jgi:putative transcriptional regulator